MSFRRKFLRQRYRIAGRPWSARLERAVIENRKKVEQDMIEKAEKIAHARIAATPKNWLGRVVGAFRRRTQRRA